MRLIQKTHTYSRILSPPPPSPLYPFSALICLYKNNNKTILTAVQTSTFVQSHTIHRHSCSGVGSRMNAFICTYCILITVQRRGREWMRARTTKAWQNTINKNTHEHTCAIWSVQTTNRKCVCLHELFNFYVAFVTANINTVSPLRRTKK